MPAAYRSAINWKAPSAFKPVRQSESCLADLCNGGRTRIFDANTCFARGGRTCPSGSMWTRWAVINLVARDFRV
jgi:hypothetical protein